MVMKKKQTTKQEPSIQVPQLAASRHFRKFKTEEKKEDRKLDVKNNTMLEQFRALWRSCFKSVKEVHYDDCGKLHSALSEQLRKMRYSSKDIEEFSVMLAEFVDEEDFPGKAGLFLSALINGGKDPAYKIHVNHLDCLFDYLGHYNRKKIRVMGGVGVWLGREMKRGEIIVEGGTNGAVGDKMNGGRVVIKGCTGSVGYGMKGGEIIVEGDAEDAGEMMEGGEIIVKGNAALVGDCMEGGEIHIEGGIESIGDITHGKIFHKRKLIFDK